MPITHDDMVKAEQRVRAAYKQQRVYNRMMERKAQSMRDQGQAAVVMLVLAGILIIGWAWDFFIKGRRGR